MPGSRGAAVVLGMVLGLVPALGGCDSVGADPGLRAVLRVRGGQFYDSPPPLPAGGPEVTAMGTSSSIVRAGRGTVLYGQVPRGTGAIALWLPGDAGYWLVEPGVPDLLLPAQLTFEARLEVSPLAPAGPAELRACAVDETGVCGPLRKVSLAITSEAEPTGVLVVALGWSGESDLDLHLVAPGPVEVWEGNINSTTPPPPGELADPEAWKQGGVLDFDSNKGCVIDGQRRENVVWEQEPPAGHYLVRVDPSSLCGEPEARWWVEVRWRGAVVRRASGLFVPEDTRFPHGEGAGVLALELDIN
jgi:hypothetical protein